MNAPRKRTSSTDQSSKTKPGPVFSQFSCQHQFFSAIFERLDTDRVDFQILNDVLLRTERKIPEFYQNNLNASVDE